MHKEVLKPYLSYRRYEQIENMSFPESETGLDIRIKIINSLSYNIYIHSLFPVCKMETNKRGINNEVAIFADIRYPGGKRFGIKFIITEDELNRRMIYIKELNLLICNMEDYISGNEKDNGFLTKEITDISTYIQAAIRDRLNRTGNPPIYFNFNDPSKTYQFIYVSMFGKICEIPIDNNPHEKLIGEILIEYGKYSEKMVISMEELFDKKKTRYISEDSEILITLDREILSRALDESKLHKNQLYSFDALEREKDLLKEKQEEEKIVLKANISTLEKKIDLIKQEKDIELSEYKNRTNQLKLKNDELCTENEKLRITLKSDLEIKKINNESEKVRIEETKCRSDYDKLNVDKEISDLKLKKEESSAKASEFSDKAKIIGVSISLIASLAALYKTFKPKPKDSIHLLRAIPINSITSNSSYLLNIAPKFALDILPKMLFLI